MSKDLKVSSIFFANVSSDTPRRCSTRKTLSFCMVLFAKSSSCEVEVLIWNSSSLLEIVFLRIWFVRVHDTYTKDPLQLGKALSNGYMILNATDTDKNTERMGTNVTMVNSLSIFFFSLEIPCTIGSCASPPHNVPGSLSPFSIPPFSASIPTPSTNPPRFQDAQARVARRCRRLGSISSSAIPLISGSSILPLYAMKRFINSQMTLSTNKQ